MLALVGVVWHTMVVEVKAFKKECGVLITEDNLASKLDFVLCVRTQLQNHKKLPQKRCYKLF